MMKSFTFLEDIILYLILLKIWNIIVLEKYFPGLILEAVYEAGSSVKIGISSIMQFYSCDRIYLPMAAVILCCNK